MIIPLNPIFERKMIAIPQQMKMPKALIYNTFGIS